jgi:hypothetical protein
MSDRGAEHQGGPSPPTPYPSVHLDGVHVRNRPLQRAERKRLAQRAAKPK